MSVVSVIGAGRMGSALARALLKAGHAVHVWNRTPARLEPLAALGARIAPSPEAAVAASDIVLINVLDYAAADTHLRTPAVTAVLRGRLLVQLTSGSPGQAREAGAWAEDHGAAYLDGAIMATPNVIGEPSATILYSGARTGFERNREVFAALGGNPLFVGEEYGHASALDIALLSQLWGTLFGTLQAIAVSQAEGVDLGDYAAYLAPFRPIIDGAVDDLVVRVRDGRWQGDDQTLAGIAAHHAAFQHLLETVRERDLNPSLSAAFDGIFRAAIADGHLQDDFAALAPYLRR